MWEPFYLFFALFLENICIEALCWRSHRSAVNGGINSARQEIKSEGFPRSILSSTNNRLMIIPIIIWLLYNSREKPRPRPSPESVEDICRRLKLKLPTRTCHWLLPTPQLCENLDSMAIRMKIPVKFIQIPNYLRLSPEPEQICKYELYNIAFALPDVQYNRLFPSNSGEKAGILYEHFKSWMSIIASYRVLRDMERERFRKDVFEGLPSAATVPNEYC